MRGGGFIETPNDRILIANTDPARTPEARRSSRLSQRSGSSALTSSSASSPLCVRIALICWRRMGWPFLGPLVAVSGLLVLFGSPAGALLMAIWFLATGLVLVAGKTPEAAKEGVR